MDPIPEKIGDVIPFSDVANLLKKVSSTEKRLTLAQKTQLLNKFLNTCRDYFRKIHGNSLDSEKANVRC